MLNEAGNGRKKPGIPSGDNIPSCLRGAEYKRHGSNDKIAATGEVHRNIKSLILGSAAALVAVSGARAADAIIAEPEPVEYVRVCDAYGAGFFYIPGTETCLQISGLVWYQIGATTDRGGNDTFNYNYFFPDEYNKGTNIRVQFDARSETEWGTLRGYIRFQNAGGYGYTANVDQPVLLDQGFLSIGGLLMGYTESAWAGNNVVGGFTGWGSNTWGGHYYSYQQRQVVQYNFGGSEGVFGTVSLENDPGTSNYMPDVVGVLGYQSSWGAVWAKVGYDESVGVPLIGYNPPSGLAASAGVQLNVGPTGSNLRVIGYYSENNNAYAVGPYTAAGLLPSFGMGSRFSVLAAYQYQVNPELGLFLSGQYFNNVDFNQDGIYNDSTDAWSVEAAFVWTPVTNFEIRSEVVYDKVETQDGTVGGFLRFTRYF